MDFHHPIMNTLWGSRRPVQKKKKKKKVKIIQ